LPFYVQQPFGVQAVFNTVCRLDAFGGVSCQIANAGLGDQIEPLLFRFV
jgi:hypothetical protein